MCVAFLCRTQKGRACSRPDLFLSRYLPEYSRFNFFKGLSKEHSTIHSIPPPKSELEGVKSALLKCQSDLSSRSHELRDARSELEDGRRAHARDGSEWRQERERLLLQGQELVDRSARLELERAGLAASLEHWQHQVR